MPEALRNTRAMAANRRKERVLALDVRSSRVGFALFEGRDELVDFGARSYARRYGPLGATARKQLIRLLNLHLPSLIVFRSAFTGSKSTRARVRLVVELLRRIAKSRSVRLRFLSRKKVKSFFWAQALANKYAVAAHLADRYPDLAWKLPLAQRKPWQPEPYQMPIFDAAAVGISFLSIRRPRRETTDA